ncbi:hypothetical protein ACFY2K_11845 [Kitasatospora sp. NPDC001309]|uniref:hypothetical protein n=1 Tax=Kitasatospora sp. NPDC001309 TaxID=3364013 RepID=UPI00369DBD59
MNSPAYASQPGESGSWQFETAGGSRIQSADSISESRSQANVLVQVWRTFNNAIMISVNHGPATEMPGATTYAEPQVVFSSQNGPTSLFWVFHTGTNGYVFYTPVSATPNSQTYTPQGLWNQVPNGVATPNELRVSVIPLPRQNLFLSFRGASSNEIWTIFFDGSRWANPTIVPGARSPRTGMVAIGGEIGLGGDSFRNVIILAWTGTDRRANVIRQTYGQSTWRNHEILGDMLGDDTIVAMSGTGRGQIGLSHNNRVSLATINEDSGWDGTWSQESTAHVAYHFNLFAYAAAVYLVTAYGNGYVDWKQSRQF